MTFFQRSEQAMAHEKDVVEKQAAEWGVGADMLYLRPGSTMVRILPPYSDAGLWFRKITRHRVRTDGQTIICACPASQDLHCQICEKAQELKDTGDPAKMKFAKDNLKPSNRYLYNVLAYSAPADNRGQQPEFGKVYVLESGIMVHKQLISLDTDAMTGWVDITNLENGVNVIIKRTGSNLDTKYEVAPTGHGRSNVLADLQARGFDTSKLAPVNLDDLFTPPDEEKQAEIIAGLQIGSASTYQAPAMQPLPAQPTTALVATPAAPPAPPQTPPVAPAVTNEPNPNVVQQSTTDPQPANHYNQPAEAPQAPAIPEPPKAQ